MLNKRPNPPHPRKNRPPTYGIHQVVCAVVCFYVLVALFDAHGLYNWATRLPVSPWALTLRSATERHWAFVAALGLEEPEFTLETRWLDFEDARPLLYPRKFSDMIIHRRLRAARRLRQAAAAGRDPQLARQEHAAKEVFDGTNARALASASGPKMLILGDSIMMTIGPAIRKAVAAELRGAAIVHAKLGTGLARPDIYDWVKELRRATVHRRFDYIVMMLGTNDSQDFTEHGRILAYGSTEWVHAYNRRLDTLMTVACEGARHGIWVGLPPMRSEAFNRQRVRINSWAKRQSIRHPCMEYVATGPVIGDEHGQFASYLQVTGHLEQVRTADGVHVTARGGGLIATALIDRIAEEVGVGALAAH